MIEAVELVKSFGDFTAVHGISLHVSEGQILALLGHNGAGKTTTTRMLAAILAPTSGYARIGGYNSVTQALEVRRIIGHLTELPGLYNRMRVIEYLDFFGELHAVPPKLRRERIEEMLQRFDLWETRKLRIGEYSKGMRQKAALIRALIHDPQVLFLDEPTSAMDPHSAKMVRDAIFELKQAHRSIILCTHNLAEAEILADKIAIIRKGQIVIEGTSEELKRKLLGVPHYQVAFNQPLTLGLPTGLADLVEIVEQSERGFIFRTEEATRNNPQVLALLAKAGLKVITLSEVSRSLESVYLKIAGQPQDNSLSRDEVEQSMKKKEDFTKNLKGATADQAEELEPTHPEKGAVK
ncbi:MAG: ABC transporter ATP-binding protein [Chloroflexota bacterium]|nr:ABC transporter ATP-binding protein [Chloroflexota bacterium]